MGFDQKGNSVFRVSRGQSGQWDVNEKGFDKPIASFDSEMDAFSYARDLARIKPGSEVVAERPSAISRRG